MKQNELEIISNQLKTGNLAAFEEAITHLSKHIERNYSVDKNPLAGYLNVKTENEVITEIEVLDSAIQKHLKDLSEETLVTIFGMTFKSISYDNYNASLIVLEEIITRKNVKTQQEIIKKFFKACKSYDAGHRYLSDTVYDQLIDVLFPQFTSEALYELLKKADSDMLNSDGGDQMDALFIPALQNTTDKKLQEKLLNVYFKYDEEARTYCDEDFLDELFEEIKEVASPELINLVSKKVKKNEERNKWITLLKVPKKEDIPSIIEMLGSKIPENYEKEYINEIIEACKEIELPETSLAKLLSFIVEKKDNYLLSILLNAQYRQKSPEKIIDFLRTKQKENLLTQNDLLNIVSHIIREEITKTPLEELKIYEDFIVSDCNLSYEWVYQTQMRELLHKLFPTDYYAKDEYSSFNLEILKKILNKVTDEISVYADLSYKFSFLLNNEKYDRIRVAFYLLYPKVKQTKDEDVLAYNIIASLKLNDKPYFDLIVNEVQQIEKITQMPTYFNLARAFAHFEDREQMLFYSKECTRRGKKKESFLAEIEFKKYWERMISQNYLKESGKRKTFVKLK